MRGMAEGGVRDMLSRENQELFGCSGYGAHQKYHIARGDDQHGGHAEKSRGTHSGNHDNNKRVC